jgi:hypothetical protein
MGDAGRETGDAKTCCFAAKRSIVRRSRTRFCVSRLPSSVSHLPIARPQPKQ